MSTEKTYSFIATTKVVGYLYIAGNFRVACDKRPSAFHLQMMNTLLGWKWKDATP